jgi:hypothetical protein
MKYIYLLSLTLLFSFSSIAQVQLGSDIDGEAAGDLSGSSVSLSSDGSVVAIGAPNNDGNGIYSGHVRVYQNQSGVWTQLGDDIDGEAADESGYSISLSGNGNVVAISSDRAEGLVKMYNFISGNWVQMGDDINGEKSSFGFGNSISLSADGNIVAIGGPWNDGNGRHSGHVRVYQNQSGIWTQLGDDIDGEAAYDQSGWSVSLSSDGSVVAIGAPDNDGNGIYSGHVRVYQNQSGVWTQLGDDIDGEAIDGRSGYSVSLSSDGSVVAIGDIENGGNGDVRVYQNQSGVWTQLGDEIDGEVAGDQSGNSVSLSSDGSVVAIGALFNDGNGTNSGHTRIYQYQSGSWVQMGDDIDGEAADDRSGSVSISSDGSVVAIGAILNDGNGNNSGHVRVYEICELSSIAKQPTDVTMPIGKTAIIGLKSNYTRYQWQTNLGLGFQDLYNAAQYSGVHTDTLHVRNLSIQNDYQVFRCLTRSKFVCSDTSEVAILNVDGALSVDEIEVAFNVYPNPATDKLHIVNRSHSASTSFTVLNPLGQEVLKGNITGKEAAINVSSLSKGYYLLQIGEGEYSYRFLVQ